MISVQNVTKSYHEAQRTEPVLVLRSVSLEVKAGESVAILGPSGSGKSTLLTLLAGIERPTEGKVIVANTELSALNEKELAMFRARNLGFVFQSFHLLDNFSALQNVCIAAEIAGKDKAMQRAKDVLARVGLAERMTHRPTQLSGGECQRVAIARALVTEPKLILADEPTGALDADNAENVFQMLLELNRGNKSTLVLVTHDERLTKSVDNVFRLERGRIANAK